VFHRIESCPVSLLRFFVAASAPSTYSERITNWTLGLIFGRRMVHDAEQQDHLNESQWDLAQGAHDEEALIHKILSYESRLTRTPLGTLDNDAKACYDRIIMLFALLSARNMAFLSACKLSAKHSSQQSMQSRRAGDL
jgi:hypothetical protein